MNTSLDEKLARLRPERRARIAARAEDLAAEELALRDLRKAVDLTQARVGELLGIGQDGVSRIEKRCDMLVSTLRDYVTAMGRRLRLLAELPDRPAVEVVGLSGAGELRVANAPKRGAAPRVAKRRQRPSRRRRRS